MSHQPHKTNFLFPRLSLSQSNRMNSIISFFRLIRYPNLIFIVLTQFMLHFLLMKPVMNYAQIEMSFDNVHFALLVFSTVLIAAGGYAINDYFDVNIDMINKPNKTYVDKTIHRRSAMLVHQGLTALGILFGFYLAWKIGNLKLGMIQPIVAALLWFYSTYHKRKAFVGNVIVAFLTSLVVLIVVLYEPNLFRISLTDQQVDWCAMVLKFCLVYFVFSFLISLIREIVKDMEDVDGDEKSGARTLPVIWGISKTKGLVYLLTTAAIFMVSWIGNYWMKNEFDMRVVYYSIIPVQVLLASQILFLKKAKFKKQFATVSLLLKITMLVGISSIAVLYFTIFKQLAQ